MGCNSSKNIVAVTTNNGKQTAVFLSKLIKREGSSIYRRPWGVTKLRNKIYVLVGRLDSSPLPQCEIFVFEDQKPFRLQKKIETNEIKEHCTDIASIEKENSLYVFDCSARKCVWKLKEEEDDNDEADKEMKKKKIIRWLEVSDEYYRSFIFSVTSDGHLLMVLCSEENALMIYGGESDTAKLVRSIPLLEDIQIPLHAVKTSRGNFIIIHSEATWKQVEEGMDKEMRDWKMVVSEVSGDGKTIVRRFSPKGDEQKLDLGCSGGYLSIDSLDRVYLADCYNCRVVLLDSNLQWNGVLIPTEEERTKRKMLGAWIDKLFYDEEKKQLIIGHFYEVSVYSLTGA